jgi:hypothetical protein
MPNYAAMQSSTVFFIRVAEVVSIVGLSIAAWITYRELEEARKVPVFLPSYEFEAVDDGEKGPGIRARGTWVAEKGPPEPLQTTTIECRKNRKECVESSAIVEFVSGKGMLESMQTTFVVDRWTDKEIVTQATPGPCGTRALVMDLSEKRATLKASGREASARCTAAPERTLELVAGYRVRAEALKRPAAKN